MITSKLVDPQIDRVTCWKIAIITKVVITLPRIVKLSPIRLCDTNPMIRSAARITSSTHHNHGSVTMAPIAPERHVMTALKIAATINMSKSGCGRVTISMSPVRNITTSTTAVTVPHHTISEVPVTSYTVSKCYTTKAVLICVQ